MQDVQGRPKHIIWQDESETITILDIPRSIEDAHHDGDSTLPLRLVSNQPPSVPYKTPNPNGEAARARLMSQHTQPEEHCIYEAMYSDARKQIGEGVCWLLERMILPEEQSVQESVEDGSKRKRTRSSEQTATIDLGKLFEILNRQYEEPSGTDGNHADQLDLTSLPVVRNTSTEHAWLKMVDNKASSFYIPSYSTFLCQDITRVSGSADLRKALRDQYGGSTRFDAVILDPPWHNASVKRSRRYTTLAPLKTTDLLAATDLEMLMNDQCLVCMWITNKPSAREAVLGEEGIFASWGVQLIEEWVWYKMTSNGELVFPLDTIMRKPYEVLLLGRKHRSYPIPPAAEPIMCRALLAVPDLHSRKPCLKALMKPLLSTRDNHLTLEVFARHLVAGWWSWGNECILFNEKANWIEV